MPRDLTEAQLTNLALPSSRPVYCVWIEHSGMIELLSSAGDVVFGGLPFTAGGVNIKRIQDSQSATIELPATPTRIAEVQNGTWRYKPCYIFVIPGTPSDSGVYATAEGLTLLSGIIDDSKFSENVVTVTVIHQNLDGNYTPRNLYDEVCNHIPAPGTVITWDSETLVLESRA